MHNDFKQFFPKKWALYFRFSTTFLLTLLFGIRIY